MTNEYLSRQTRLREVGKKGQELIAAARVVLGDDAASLVAAEYLSRSGVRSVERDRSRSVQPFRHAGHFTYCVTGQFAHGACVATKVIASVLGLSDKSLIESE